MQKIPSRFMKRTLMSDEKILEDAGFSRIYIVEAMFSLMCFTIAGYAVSYGLAYYHLAYTYIPLYAGAAIGFLYAFFECMRIWTTEIILTDRRLILKSGFFFVNIEEVDIEQLASDYIEQSILGRLFGYGAIRIRCIQAKDMVLPPITNPYIFRNALERAKQEYRERYINIGRLYKQTLPDAPVA